MRAQRLIATTVVVLLAGSGCSADDGGATTVSPAPRPPVTIPADPVAALAAAQAQLGTETVRVALDTGSDFWNFAGVAGTGSWEMTGQEYVIRRVGTDLYVRASGKSLASLTVPDTTVERIKAGGWVHTRLPNWRDSDVLLNDEFPRNLADRLSHATGVTRTGARSFTGRVAAEKGKAGGFARLSADLDDRGRFTRIAFDADKSGPGQHFEFTFSDFGVPAAVTAPPPADVVEEENPSFLSGLALI